MTSGSMEEQEATRGQEFPWLRNNRTQARHRSAGKDSGRGGKFFAEIHPPLAAMRALPDHLSFSTRSRFF